jgi:23S rRNA pseudouridine1911/1915/1917 synthase
VEPLEFSVSPEFEGQRLDRFLVAVLADHSRSQIQKLIEDGYVRVDARQALIHISQPTRHSLNGLHVV